jgi:N-acetylglucosaminyldiphosphoundecaprenol N-acetyl-beta-D-mannosaminyltransferase
MFEKVTSVAFNDDMVRPFNITYLNNSNYLKVRYMDFSGFTHIGADGSLFKVLYNLFSKRKKIRRTSFDFTSNAPEFLDYVDKNDLKVCFIGGTQSEIDDFKSLVIGQDASHEKFGFYSGYPLDEGFASWSDFLADIDVSDYDVVVLGLGAPLQEKISILIMNLYESVSTVTCGGFISQCSMSGRFDYFPYVFNKLNIRWMYRVFREPHVLRRLIFDYPKSVPIIIYRCLCLGATK